MAFCGFTLFNHGQRSNENLFNRIPIFTHDQSLQDPSSHAALKMRKFFFLAKQVFGYDVNT